MALGRKTGGRKKGTPNKVNKEAADIMRLLNCCPVEASVRIAKRLEEDGELVQAGKMYIDLIAYRHPKLKSVEHDATDEMTQVLRDLTGVKRTKGIHGAS